uniref:Uncharacterized protein n=1 Tax=Arundo donax TaxID=35708 RepID=A0A0A8ZJ64_ARUDO
MSTVQISLAFQIFQSFMIRMYNKFLRPKIISPRFQNTHKSIEFFVIYRIIQLSTSKFLTKICNRFTILYQNTTNSNPTSITFNLKSFSEIR